MILEVCIDSFDTALLAAKYNAKRVELCSALSVGGLTPSLPLVKKCVALNTIETHVMIRPREGNFIYSDLEIDIMQSEIQLMADAGVAGVVFGCLDAQYHLHPEHNQMLCSIPKKHNLEITFHRAFDFSENPMDALEQLIELGVDRILTSGQEAKAIEGKDFIHTLVQATKGRIQIMAGSGVNHSNALELANLGIDALHFTSHKSAEKTLLGMGVQTIPNEDKISKIHRLFQ